MSFLNAIFLAGLAGVAIPLAIHFLHRERPRTVAFGWLAFLETAHRAEARRFRMRELLLLILRGLLCALLALAFARPFFADAATDTEAARPPHAVLVVDVSYSMRAGTRWNAARRAAIGWLDARPAGDRVAVIAAARTPRTIVDFTDDLQSARAAVGGLAPGFESTDLGAAFRLAEARLRNAQARQRSLVVISDHQSAGWRRLDPGDRASPGIDVQLVDVGGDDGDDNLAVIDVRPFEAGTAGVAARLRNYGAGDRQVLARLVVDGAEVEARSTRVAADGTVDLEFEDVLSPAERRASVGAWVEIDDDALAPDNRRYLILEPQRRWRVLCVDPGGISGSATFYLQRALNPWGEGHGDIERPRVMRPDAVRPEALTGLDAVFLIDDGQLSTDAVHALEDFVRAGGGLVVATAPGARLHLGDLLPTILRVDPYRVLESEGFALLTDLDYSHRLFAPFRGGRHGDFGAVRTRAYTRVDLADEAGVLMRFDGGDPALVEHDLGDGRVLLFTATFDTTWTDLPKRALFPPFVHQVMGYLGESADTTAGSFLVGERPADARLLEPGVVSVTTTAGERLVAVNVDVAEADLRRVDLEALRARLQPAATTASADSTVVASVVPLGRDQALREEREQRVWWWLMWGVLGLAVSEMILANRIR